MMHRLFISLPAILALSACVGNAPSGDPQDNNYRSGIYADAYDDGPGNRSSYGGGCVSCTSTQADNLAFARSELPGSPSYGGAVGAAGGLRGGYGGGQVGGLGGSGRGGGRGR